MTCYHKGDVAKADCYRCWKKNEKALKSYGMETRAHCVRDSVPTNKGEPHEHKA